MNTCLHRPFTGRLTAPPHTRRVLIRRIVSTLSIVVLIQCQAAVAAPNNASPVPAEISGLYYHLGGGRYLPPPGSNMSSYNIAARYRVGLGYSCGQFNFQDNITTMVNQMMTRVRQVPSQLTSAASAAVAGLPGYLIQKANPTLYNIITKTLDETANLFNLSFQSCQQLERELRQSPGTNPYQGFMRASIADRWTVGAGAGETAADVDEAIKENPREPIKWLGDNLYGTVANPLQINHDIVVAGYNIMLGRTSDVSITTAPVGALANQPIVKIWSSPLAAGRWAQEVLGDTKVVLVDNTVKPETIAGKGLRPQVDLLEEPIHAALKLALNTDDYSDLNKYTSTRISSGIVESLRAMPAGEAAVMIDRLISELAVSEARERLMLIKQMLLTGLKAPDLVASTAGATAVEYIRGTTFPDMERVTQEIFDALELKQKTVNRTTINILNHRSQQQSAGASKRPNPIDSGPNLLNGAVRP